MRCGTGESLKRLWQSRFFYCVTWIGWGLCLLNVVPHLVSSQEEQSVGVQGGVIIVEEVAKS